MMFSFILLRMRSLQYLVTAGVSNPNVPAVGYFLPSASLLFF